MSGKLCDLDVRVECAFRKCKTEFVIYLSASRAFLGHLKRVLLCSVSCMQSPAGAPPGARLISGQGPSAVKSSSVVQAQRSKLINGPGSSAVLAQRSKLISGPGSLQRSRIQSPAGARRGRGPTERFGGKFTTGRSGWSVFDMLDLLSGAHGLGSFV